MGKSWFTVRDEVEEFATQILNGLTGITRIQRGPQKEGSGGLDGLTWGGVRGIDK